MRRRVTPPGEILCSIETERETDRRWIAEAIELSGVLAYGTTRFDATSRCVALALRVVAEKIEFDKMRIASLKITIASN